MEKFFSFLLLLVVFRIVTFAETPVKDSGTHYVQDVLQPYVDKGELPGAISVLYKDGVQEVCCIGYADVEKKRAITMSDPFMQCSQSKAFCGVAMAKLVEDGKLSLDDPVSKYLPEFETLWVTRFDRFGIRIITKARNVLTVRMVMNHTGGFPFETSAKRNDVRGGGWSGGAPLRQNACIAAASPLLFEPGTGVRYSNTGIDISAAIIETVTGMKYENYLKSAVLEPLEMHSTWFWPTDKQIEDKIEIYEIIKNKPARWMEEIRWAQRPYNDSHVFVSAAAGMWTTADDQLKFYKMLLNLGVGDNGVRILKEETVKTLLTVSTRPEGMEGYSLGLKAPVQDNEDAWVGHGGALGTRCMFNWHKKELKLWVVQQGGADALWEKEVDSVADKFFGTTIDNLGVNAYTRRVK